jgi:hypothetical protein
MTGMKQNSHVRLCVLRYSLALGVGLLLLSDPFVWGGNEASASGTVRVADGSAPPIGQCPASGATPTFAGLFVDSSPPGAFIDGAWGSGPFSGNVASLSGPVGINAPAQLGTVRFGAAASTCVPYSCSTGPCAFSAEFYLRASQPDPSGLQLPVGVSTVNCSGPTCSPSFNVPLFAAYGSLHGKVHLSAGGVVGAGVPVAIYGAGDVTDIIRTTFTDANGTYDFASNDPAIVLLGNALGLPIADSQMIPLTNHWGLRVYGDGTTSGRGVYWVVAGADSSGEPRPATATLARQASIASSEAASLDLVADGSCPIPPLDPINDPLETQPIDTVHLTAATASGLACLQKAVLDAVAKGPATGTATLESAYRTDAYQQHLKQVWDYYMELIPRLSPDQKAACSALITSVNNEFGQKHHLTPTQTPIDNSFHSVGRAVDLNISFTGDIDALAASCNPPLIRTSKRKDKAHFQGN